jgi:hypothetical protein
MDQIEMDILLSSIIEAVVDGLDLRAYSIGAVKPLLSAPKTNDFYEEEMWAENSLAIKASNELAMQILDDPSRLTLKTRQNASFGWHEVVATLRCTVGR